MRRSMRLLSMAARAMVSICVEGQPAPAQRPWFCFALMARRRLRVGRPGTCVAMNVRSTDRWTKVAGVGARRRGTSFCPAMLLSQVLACNAYHFAFGAYLVAS